MYSVTFTTKFRKDLKTIEKRGYNIELLKQAISELMLTGTLPAKNKPHKLSGPFVGYKEAHLDPDWLLIWKTEGGIG